MIDLVIAGVAVLVLLVGFIAIFWKIGSYLLDGEESFRVRAGSYSFVLEICEERLKLVCETPMPSSLDPTLEIGSAAELDWVAFFSTPPTIRKSLIVLGRCTPDCWIAAGRGEPSEFFRASRGYTGYGWTVETLQEEKRKGGSEIVLE